MKNNKLEKNKITFACFEIFLDNTICLNENHEFVDHESGNHEVVHYEAVSHEFLNHENHEFENKA